MKKILLTLGSIATVATPIVAVVSCGDDNKTTTNPNVIPTAQQATLKTAAATALGMTAANIDHVSKAASVDFTEAGNKKTLKNVVIYKIKSDVKSFTVSNGAGSTTTVTTTGGGRVMIGSSDTALRAAKKFYIVTEVPSAAGTTTTLAEITDSTTKTAVETNIVNTVFVPAPAATNTQTVTTVSVEAAKKIADGLLADNRILNGALNTNDMDAFINKLIKLTISAQKELGETPLFSDDFTFSHSNAASVEKTATVIRSVLAGLFDKIPMVGSLLKEKVTVDAIKELLAEEHITTGIAKLVHRIDILSLVNMVSRLNPVQLKALIEGAMPIKDHTDATPVTMVLPVLKYTESEPSFMSGTTKSLNGAFDLGSMASGMSSTPAPAPAAAPAAGATTGTATSTTTAPTEVLKKFDLMGDLFPKLSPKDEDRRMI